MRPETNTEIKKTVSKSEKGFSLLEILIAMVMIGILSAIVIPKYQVYIVQSKVMSAFASLNALKPSLEQRLAYDQSPNSKLSLQDLGGHQLDEQALGSITLNQTQDVDPIYELQVTFVAEAIEGQFIKLQRQQGTWSCITDLPTQFRPAYCQDSTTEQGSH